MIQKMYMVHIVASASGKKRMLEGLRELGVMHISEKKTADKAASEKFARLSKTSMMLTDYAPAKGSPEKELLSDEDFGKLYRDVLEAAETRTAMLQTISTDRAEIERIRAWGEFSPEEVKALRRDGFDFHFYRLGKQEAAALKEAEDVRYIRLAPVDGMECAAVLGKLPEEIPGQELALPEKSAGAFEEEIAGCTERVAACEAVFRNAAYYQNSFYRQMLSAQNEENYSAASATAEGDEDLCWISGYVPEEDLDSLKAAAAENSWAWAYEDVADDDEAVPTKVKYNKVSALIKPVFDILGILPGYREQDISLWFFLFFILFFAMIIGDGAYGLLILTGTGVIIGKQRKLTDTTFLLLVLSVATVIWGAVTGTWFGMEAAMKVPLLKALVIPEFANYPQYFTDVRPGLTSTVTQNTIMKFSFTIGAVQMTLGSLLAIRKKLSEKDLSWVADLGWIIAIAAMYLLSLYLVIGENYAIRPIFALIITAYLIVVLFSGMSPDRTFAQGLKAGLADAFTNFLNTISCFGNVMSYIRLFAVGMAGLAISQSFNSMASGFEGPLVIVGAVIVIIGHALNIVMCFLSVIVHGVRLNVLEFSGQVGLEWTGILYDPFRRNKKVRF